MCSKRKHLWYQMSQHYSVPRTVPGQPSLSALWTAPLRLSALSKALKSCTNKDLKEQLHVKMNNRQGCFQYPKKTLLSSYARQLIHIQMVTTSILGTGIRISQKCESVKGINERTNRQTKEGRKEEQESHNMPKDGMLPLSMGPDEHYISLSGVLHSSFNSQLLLFSFLKPFKPLF